MKRVEGTHVYSSKITRENRGSIQVRDTLRVTVDDGVVTVHCSSEEGKKKSEFNTTFNLSDFSDWVQGVASTCESIVTRDMG